MLLCESNLVKALDAIVVQGSWASAARAVPMSEGGIYNWLRRSAADRQKGLKESSPFYIRWQDEGPRYWDEWCREARARNILGLEGVLREQARNGQTELCFDPASGRPLIALAPAFAHLSAAEFAERYPFCAPEDRYQWELDAEGNRIRPIYQTKTTQLPASMRQAVARAVLPIYKDHATLDVQHRGAVVVHVEPVPFHVLKARRQEAIEDAQFEDVPQRSLEDLRREAAEILARPGRITQPNAPVKNVYGEPINDRASAQRVGPDRQDLPPRSSGATRVSMSPQPQEMDTTQPQQPPPYARRKPRQPDPLFSVTKRPGAFILK